MAPVAAKEPWLLHIFRDASTDDRQLWLLVATSCLGLLVLARFLLTTLWVILSVLLPGKSLKSFGAKKGAWAVVTGSTAGMGAEFARQLAKAGFRIVLVSRDASKLETQAKEITAAVGRETLTFAIDFAKASADDYNQLAKLLAPLDIGVLVNNVGQSHAYPEYFAEIPQGENERIIEINIASMVRLTHLIVPGMVSRKRGLILNFSSISAYANAPLLSVYASSKAFLSTFSNAIGHELAPSGVVVRCLNTYYVSTGMSRMRPSFFAPTARGYVRSVLGHIGNGGGAAGGLPYLSNPYPPHALAQWFIDHFLPWPILLRITESSHVGIRKRAIAKRNRLQAQQKQK